MPEQTLLATMTGEHFQPVRLRYQVLNRSGLLRAFEKLSCIDRDQTQQRWVWLYAHEAKKLKFPRSHAQIPQELHPIVIGSFFLRPEATLLLDLRSCERAILAIPFFDKMLPRKLVRLVNAEIVNRLFPATDANQQLTPTTLFDSQPITAIDPEALLRRFMEKMSNITDPNEKARMLIEEGKTAAREPLPEMERFPVHYHEDGLAGFKLAVRVRQIVALKHWQGYHEYTLNDTIQALHDSS